MKTRFALAAAAGIVALAGLAGFAQPDRKPSNTPATNKPAQPATNSPANNKPAGQPSEKEMMEQMMKLGMPGEAHKKLSSLEGTWDCDVSEMSMEGGTPTASKASFTATWILDGRWLQQKFEGQMMQMPYKGFGLLGYDNMQKEYTSIWADNMSTQIMQTTGQFDDSKKTLTLKGECTDPMGGKMQQRHVTTIVGPDKFTMDFFGTGPDGKEEKMMAIAFTRRGPAPRGEGAMRPDNAPPR